MCLQIFEGIRDFIVQSVELKFNCFFLMPLIDTFPQVGVAKLLLSRLVPENRHRKNASQQIKAMNGIVCWCWLRSIAQNVSSAFCTEQPAVVQVVRRCSQPAASFAAVLSFECACVSAFHCLLQHLREQLEGAWEEDIEGE